MGRPGEAAADLDAACGLEPDSAEFLRSRGMCHRAAGRLAEALADFERTLSLAPDDPSALSNRGCGCCLPAVNSCAALPAASQ
jgi:Flp pilus assembly protein TadD